MAAGPVLVTVPSESNPSKSYEIRLGHDGNVYCSCPAWKFQKVHPHLRVCKHMKALSKEIGEAAAKLKGGGTKVAAPAPKAAPVAAPAPAVVAAVETDPEAEVVALEKALAEKKAALAAKKAAAEAAAKKAAAAKKVAELKAALAAAEAELAA